MRVWASANSLPRVPRTILVLVTPFMNSVVAVYLSRRSLDEGG
jgi:hypothetical protein